jgi:hypothetical protein
MYTISAQIPLLSGSTTVDVVLCAHNGNACDFPLLAKELTTHGLSLPDKITMTFDTLSVTKQHKQIDYHGGLSSRLARCGTS